MAATNRDLYEAVARGQFRPDLYYRLNVFDIRIPPLRQRREDILVLAASFLREFDQAPEAPSELMPDSVHALLRHELPGNVRELRNALERATIVCQNGAIRAADLSLWPAPETIVESTDLEVLERRAIERVMRDVNGNKAKASRELGISRTQLYIRLRKYG